MPAIGPPYLFFSQKSRRKRIVFAADAAAHINHALQVEGALTAPQEFL